MSFAAAEEEPYIIMMDWPRATAYPKAENNVSVYLTPLSDALTGRYTTDAHFQPLTTNIKRRLNNDAIGKVPISVVYYVADVDDPFAHLFDLPARESWRAAEQQKIDKLRKKRPGAVVYWTRGGYRIIFRCAEPFQIASISDKEAWWARYHAFRRYLFRVADLVVDPTCKDFGRLYRFPRVRRDDEDLNSTILGDPANIEALDAAMLSKCTQDPPDEPISKLNKFVRAELTSAGTAVLSAPNGSRNDALNKKTFALAGYVPKYLSGELLREAMVAAILANGGDEKKDGRKIDEAIAAGIKKPRDIPDGGVGDSTSSSGASRAKRGPAAGAAAPEENEGGRPEAGADDRPIIQITADIHGMTCEASDALGRDPLIFERNDELVHVTRVSRDDVQRSRVIETDDGPRRELVEGTPRIRTVRFATLKERLSAIADFQKWSSKSKEWVPARPDGDVVAALLERGEWAGVPSLRAIVETPTLRPDGSILQGEPGYDAATRLLYAPNAAFPLVPDQPTQADARKAYAMLVDLLADFPHEDDERDSKGRLVKAGSHKAVAIAHAGTLVGRAAITNSGIPMFVYDANTRGSGKTLQTDFVALTTTGRPMPRMTYPHSDEELEKLLAGYALRGATLFCLDNVTRPLGGGPLDKILTARDLVELRVLGRNYVPTLIWLAVASATGNNVGFQADTSRRVLVSRLESLETRPETRTDFKQTDLLGYVLANRPAIVVALLTILRAYFVAGRPDMGCGTWGSFEQWAALIAQAIVFAGGADPMRARAEADANPEEDAFAAFLRAMQRKLAADGHERDTFAAADVKEWLYPELSRPTDDLAREVREAVETLCGRAPPSAVSNVLGLKLRKYRDRVFEVGDTRLRLIKDGEHAKSARWAIREVGRA
jgi:hypothetical protein